MHRVAILASVLCLTLSAQRDSETKAVVPIFIPRKVALLIGNANYQHIPAVGPALADANDMGAALRRLHFDTVEVQTDLNADALIETINRFSRSQVREGDLALLYYSGHGGQSGEENYLLPIDYDPPSEDDLVERRGGYKMSRVRDLLESRGARVRVLIFDACRNSPVVSTKDAGGGLRQMEGKPEGTFIAYASAHNQASRFQNWQRNSFYTAELLDALRTSNGDLKSLFEQVQLRVYHRTNGTQRPYVYGFLSAPVYLGPMPVSATAAFPSRPAVSAEEETQNAHVASIPRQDDLPSGVMATLNRWRATQIAGDVDAQTNCYAPYVEIYFRERNVDRERLRSMKRSWMAAYPDTRAYDLTEVQLQSSKDDRVTLTFHKFWDAYGAKHFSGEEKQRLTFLRVEGSWKIVREEELQIYWYKKE